MNKNRLLFIFVLITLLPATLFSQGITKWNVGVEAGLNYSDSSEDTAPLEKKRPVLPKIGVSLEYNIQGDLYVQSGVTYSMKGLKSSGDTENLKASVKLYQQVIQIPVLLNYRFPINKFHVSIGAGGYYSYGVGGKTKAVGIVNGNDIDIEKNTFGNILERQDFGLTFKLSPQFRSFLLNLSYEHGLKNIGKANVMGAPLDYENRVASITIGYLF